jgi:hypothetical protein
MNDDEYIYGKMFYVKVIDATCCENWKILKCGLCNKLDYIKTAGAELIWPEIFSAEPSMYVTFHRKTFIIFGFKKTCRQTSWLQFYFCIRKPGTFVYIGSSTHENNTT